MADLETMFAEIAKRGWLVNNLFQLNDSMWRCNVRRKTEPRTPGEASSWAHEFADGLTHREAVAGALSDLKQPRNNERVRGTPKTPTEKAIEDSGL